MSRWQGSARTNYVKIKPECLPKLFEKFDHLGVGYKIDSDKGLMFYAQSCDEVLLDTLQPDQETMDCLEQGQVLIVMSASFDGIDYVGGSATAYHTDGRIVMLKLEDIYSEVTSRFNVDFPTLTRAED